MGLLDFLTGSGGSVDQGYLDRQFVSDQVSKPPEEWSPEFWRRAREIPGYLENTTGSISYDAVKGKDPQVIAQREAERQAQVAAQTQTATTTTPYTAPEPPPPTPEPPPPPPSPEPTETEEQRLAREMAERERQRGELRSGALSGIASAFPTGFESTLAPTSLYGPISESIYARERAKPEELIANMLKRGTLTETGRARGVTALEQQAPAIREKLTGIGNLLLERERAGLRGIAGRGRAAAGALELGQTFDPGTYRGEAEQSVSGWQQSLPQMFSEQVGNAPLFDVSGLGPAAGGVTGQPEAFDPYAGAGGQLTTGLESPGDVPKAKRRTSVF